MPSYATTDTECGSIVPLTTSLLFSRTLHEITPATQRIGDAYRAEACETLVPMFR